MRVRVLLPFAAVVGLVFIAGCARERAGSSASAAAAVDGGGTTNALPSSQKMIVTPEEGLDGKVAWVNANLRFVVVTFPVGQMAAIDQRLSVYRQGLKVGEVKITGPQRDDSIVGDITAGECGVGDEVRNR